MCSLACLGLPAASPSTRGYTQRPCSLVARVRICSFHVSSYRLRKLSEDLLTDAPVRSCIGLGGV